MEGTPPILQRFRAVLFDMDGVLTTTQRLHSASWQRTFDEFLGAWDRAHHVATTSFTPADYARLVDGKPRLDGVRDFLADRGIELPEGNPDDPPGEWTVNGIANTKQDYVEEALSTEGVEAFPGTVAWLRDVRAHGLSTAVVTSSKNCERILDAAGIGNLFDAKVDGNVADELDLPGKPAPDTFLEAARRLFVDPSDVVVVEDALAGVAAGRAGHFGLVIGVNRSDQARDLLAAGADLVVDDLADLVVDSAAVEHPAGPKAHRLRAAAARLLAAEEEFPVEEFRLIERGFNPDAVTQLETLFAVGNGYLGIRGGHDEGRPCEHAGTLCNGFFETWPIEYPESAYGFATTGQTILDVPDGSIIKLYVDDEPFDLTQAEVLDYERALDMRAGTLDRRVVWARADGARFAIRSRRMVSLEHRHTAAVEYEIEALDTAAHVVVSSEMALPEATGEPVNDDPRRPRRFAPGVMAPVAHDRDEARVVMGFETRSSGLQLACGMDHLWEQGELTVSTTEIDESGEHARVVFRGDLAAGQVIRLEKLVAYHHDGPNDADISLDELRFRVRKSLTGARQMGWRGLLAAQRRRVEEFWAVADVRTEGAPLVQQAMRFSLFQLLQASARVEGLGIPAKGVSGRGYEGHYFWDTEIYVMPFLIYTAPSVARSLLRHRYDMLDTARRRARELGHPGALFPWRTIGGEEASAYYAAGTAQYHINADVAFALMQYVRTTGDDQFLLRYGAEILVETARLWAALGFFSDRKSGRFVINGVTGPDEYSTVVDNNAYTNLMARENLRAAVDTIEWMRDAEPQAFQNLVERTGLTDEEPLGWLRAADLMYVPFDDEQQVHLQHDGFFEQEVWDFEGTPPEKYPLLLHFHPLVIYRHQVIKQADIVLATVLLSNEFTAEERRRIFEYYDPLTTGDSSLSECVQGIAAAAVGELRAAEEYFVDAVSVDLADEAGNVADGIHIASAAGAWMTVVMGFAGMRDHGDPISFRPVLPERFTRLAFSLRVRNCLLEVEMRNGTATYRLREGLRLRIRHAGELLDVTADGVTRPLIDDHVHAELLTQAVGD